MGDHVARKALPHLVTISAWHAVGRVLQDEVVEAEIDIGLELLAHGFGTADQLEVEPRTQIFRVGQLLGGGHELAVGLEFFQLLPGVGVGLVMLDHLLEVARQMNLRECDCFFVGIRQHRVDQDRPGDVCGTAAPESLVIPAIEVVAVEVHREVRDPDHGEVELGHDAGAFWAAGRAVQIHPLLHGLRPEFDGPLNVEELARIGEGPAGERLADNLAALAEARAGLGHGNAEGIVFEAREAAPEAEVERAPAELAQHRDLACEPERAVPG